MLKMGRFKVTPCSCDCFVVLPSHTADNSIVFGKNSDRPNDEVMEVTYLPACDYEENSKLKCTYIEVDQVSHTFSMILSKPAWMWGAEMGANEHNVCIGNEAVWTHLMHDSDSEEKLIGMDLLRLALERSASSFDAVTIITSLIDKYGMGGNCAEDFSMVYHNSFLIADPREVWVLECAGNVWAAEKVTEGVRNISNELSIHTTFHRSSDNLENIAKEKGLWDGKGTFDFANAFATSPGTCFRSLEGKRLLTQFSKDKDFVYERMFKILSDKRSDICMVGSDFITTGSQVSYLAPPDSGLQSCHWFTATPDPSMSLFKPFIFTENVTFPREVQSEYSHTVTPAQMKKLPGKNRKHKLHLLREEFYRSKSKHRSAIQRDLHDLQAELMQLAEKATKEYDEDKEVARNMFNDAVQKEQLYYSNSNLK